MSAPIAAAAPPAGEMAGRWATPDGGVVEFGICGEPARNASTCGRIAALGGAVGGERLDTRNPRLPLRARRVLGRQIIGGLRQIDTGAWSVKALYNPDDGHTYSGAIRLVGDDRLQLKGCALAVLCRTQVWRRLP